MSNTITAPETGAAAHEAAELPRDPESGEPIDWALPLMEAPAKTTTPARATLLGRARRLLLRQTLRAALAGHAVGARLARAIAGAPRRPRAGEGAHVMLTGTFHSVNWLAAHLRPLEESRAVSKVTVVTTIDVKPTAKVAVVHPPAWLVRAVGAVPARLLTFVRTAIAERPHVVGGFHLLVNGLLASLLAPMVRARSVYFCVGGQTELLHGGLHSENKIFSQIEDPDPVIESRLLRAVEGCDTVVTMGARAARFLQRRGVRTRFRTLAGGIDAERFARGAGPRTIDILFVGRLAPIKRVDRFLRAVALVIRARPEIRATVVGDGPLRPALESLARGLHIEPHVSFVGQQDAVHEYLRRSRVLVLTSDSEGLPLSVMEAMTAGVPAVVSDVGELSDLIEDGVNGRLVKELTPASFADAIREVLEPARWAAFSDAASRAAERHTIQAAAERWNEVLEGQE